MDEVPETSLPVWPHCSLLAWSTGKVGPGCKERMTGKQGSSGLLSRGNLIASCLSQGLGIAVLLADSGESGRWAKRLWALEILRRTCSSPEGLLALCQRGSGKEWGTCRGRAAWIRGTRSVLHPPPLGRGMAHSKASAGFPVPLPSGVTLNEASAARRKAGAAGRGSKGWCPWGRQRGGQEGEHRRREGRGQASALGAKVFCSGPSQRRFM